MWVVGVVRSEDGLERRDQVDVRIRCCGDDTDHAAQPDDTKTLDDGVSCGTAFHCHICGRLEFSGFVWL